MKTFITGLTGVALVLLASCAKEKDYDEVYKPNSQSELVVAKSAFTNLCGDAKDPCLYVASTGDTPQRNTTSYPYYQGQEKLVVVKLKEKKLVFEQVPNEIRFEHNSQNFAPVLEIDAEYKDYRCKKDEFGECSNEEEEIDDREWSAKRFVKVDFNSLKVVETNTLPDSLSNLAFPCLREVKSEVKSSELTADTLNVTITKTWEMSVFCAENETTLEDLSYKVDYNYSFMKLSKIASKDYEPVDYPFEDENTFGFFTSEMTKLSADNRNTVDSVITYMNRWNPAKKEIVYNLSEGFYRPGMDAIRASTEEAVAKINNSLAKAGSDAKIVLQDGRGKNIGDVRNNFIILVEDPVALGLLGYGPSVANPRTGEILKAHTVMYYGTMRQSIQTTYEELLEEQAREEKIRAAGEETGPIALNLGPESTISEADSEDLVIHRSMVNKLTQDVNWAASSPRRQNRTWNSRDMLTKSVQFQNLKNSEEKFNLKYWVKKYKENFEKKDELSQEVAHEAHMNIMSFQCFYHESLMNWNGLLADKISPKALGIKALKPWNDLTEEERTVIINKLMPTVWVPTLVHEMGHNLGLRHNFNGSEDKPNYYNEAERASLGMTREVTYASVMDYAYSDLNQLPVMGKYDIAALRFAYKREAELKTGKMVKFENGLTFEKLKKEGKDQLFKQYQFCTDSHVAVNAGCKRFDDGSNLKEIAQHYVKAYHKRYTTANLRNRRNSFNGYNDDNYYFYLHSAFRPLRQIFELYDRLSRDGFYENDWDEILATPGLTPEQRANVISNRDFGLNLKAGAKIAADFFLDVITTPDVHCALLNKNTKEKQIVPLSEVSDEASSCFDIDWVAQFQFLGQAGKFTNHKKFKAELPDRIAAYDSELSVRGIWLDKIVAMNYLTRRRMGISLYDNDYTGNFLDYPEFGNGIRKSLLESLTDGVEREENFKMADGTITKIKHVFKLGKSDKITNSFNDGINYFFNLGIKTDMREILMPFLKRSLKNSEYDTLENQRMSNIFGASKVDNLAVINSAEVADSVNMRGTNFKFVATKANPVAAQMIKNYKAVDKIRTELSKFERFDINGVYLAREFNADRAGVPANLKPLLEKYDAPTLLSFLEETMTDAAMIAELSKIQPIYIYGAYLAHLSKDNLDGVPEPLKPLFDKKYETDSLLSFLQGTLVDDEHVFSMLDILSK